jgi:hypothetical protein
MATKITTANHDNSLSGSPDKRIDIAPDGTIWVMLMIAGSSANGLIKFFKSTNGGATWSYASGSDLNVGQQRAVPSWMIDADGFAHVSWVQWDKDPQVVRYARGKPTGGGGWSWTSIVISPASGRSNSDSDLVAFRFGSGWVVFIGHGGATGPGEIARVNVTPGGLLSVASVGTSPSGALANQIGTVEFAHNGDGKTTSAAPHVFYSTSIFTGTASATRLARLAYASGTWTWGTPVTVGSSGLNPETTICSVHDGTFLMVAYSNNSPTINVYEWDGVNTPTARTPPAAPGGVGTVLGLSMSHDPATNNIYLVFHDATDGDIRWSKFTRATLTWSAWAVAVSRSPYPDDGKVGLVRHPSRDSVDMVFANGDATAFTVYSQQLAPLVRTPSAPILGTPAAGVSMDLASGGTFVWSYSAVSPGDTQQAWAFRRQYSATTEYWNASSQAWGSTIVWNPGASGSAVFAPGKWTNGTTFSWSVATRSSGGADSAFANNRTVVATDAPNLTVDEPSAVSYSDSNPLVQWTYTCSSAQKDYLIRIFADAGTVNPDSDTPVWDSGTVALSSARTARIGATLADGGTFRAYMKVTSAAGVSSGWQYSLFTIALAAPSGPLIGGFPEISYDTGVPRVHLDVTARSSFLSSDQASGLDGWDIDVNATLTHQPDAVDTQIFEGVKITSAASGLVGIRSAVGSPPAPPFGEPTPNGPLSFPAVSGQTYTAVALLKTAATSRAFRVRLRWYDADDGTGALISESVGLQQTAGSVAYTQATVTALAPVGAVLVRMVIEVLSTAAAGEIFYMAFPSLAPGASTVWQPGGYSSTQVLRVERSDNGGATWTTIQQRVRPSLAQQAVLLDRTMPFGVDVLYRAFTDVDGGNGSTLSSAASPVSTLQVTADRWGIRDPQDPDVELYGYVVAHKRSDDEASAVHRPAGREFPIVDTEGPQAATGTLSIFVESGSVAAATAVLRSTQVMVVQSPAGEVFHARLLGRDYNIESLRHRVIEVRYVEVE